MDTHSLIASLAAMPYPALPHVGALDPDVALTWRGAAGLATGSAATSLALWWTAGMPFAWWRTERRHRRTRNSGESVADVVGVCARSTAMSIVLLTTVLGTGLCSAWMENSAIDGVQASRHPEQVAQRDRAHDVCRLVAGSLDGRPLSRMELSDEERDTVDARCGSAQSVAITGSMLPRRRLPR